MKISNEQIDELYRFTQKHFVDYYDLQTELVDHLANGIEAKWQTNPNISFKNALSLEFKKFGVFGFSEVVEERRRMLCKKYRGFIWNYFKAWWSLPKVILSASFIYLIFKVLNGIVDVSMKEMIIASFFTTIVFLISIKSYFFHRQMKLRSKKWMLQDIIFRQLGIADLFIIPVNLLSVTNQTQFLNNTYSDLALAIIMVQSVFLFKIMFVDIPQKSEELLAQTYPEYRMV